MEASRAEPQTYFRPRRHNQVEFERVEASDLEFARAGAEKGFDIDCPHFVHPDHLRLAILQSHHVAIVTQANRVQTSLADHSIGAPESISRAFTTIGKIIDPVGVDMILVNSRAKPDLGVDVA